MVIWVTTRVKTTICHHDASSRPSDKKESKKSITPHRLAGSRPTHETPGASGKTGYLNKRPPGMAAGKAGFRDRESAAVPKETPAPCRERLVGFERLIAPDTITRICAGRDVFSTK